MSRLSVGVRSSVALRLRRAATVSSTSTRSADRIFPRPRPNVLPGDPLVPTVL